MTLRLDSRTHADGTDLGPWLAQLFQVLNTPENQRAAKLDENLAQFPYVNGALFDGPLVIPSFDSAGRDLLLEACQFDWSKISPAIFGSLFQSVMDPAERRAQGAHYTTEKNILKVIEPLFLDDLRAEFETLRKRKDNRKRADLATFQKRLRALTFFDPACGCGNFLIIAYRELRLLEMDVIRELRRLVAAGQMELDTAVLSLVDVDQFYGIELGEFPARIAETALWMMDHLMNNQLSLEFGKSFVRIPLTQAPHILYGDALSTDWTTVLAPGACSFMMGNPPFVGSKFQSIQQREQVRHIADLGGSGGSLDFVAAWFIKAGQYMQGTKIRTGFVSTNSITQGEQVAQLWPVLFERHKLEIAFAHRTFAWGSDARGRAHVHVVILGLTLAAHAPTKRRLFSYDDINGNPVESQHPSLSPYLFDASKLADPHLVVREAARALNGLPALLSGTQPIEDGEYIFGGAERLAFLAVEPRAAAYLRPFIGAREYLNGGERWILDLRSATPAELKLMPHVVERMRNVKTFRASSHRTSTRALADFPARFNVEVIPDSAFLVIPEVSSERREYIPLAWLKPPVIPSNKVRILTHAKHWQFALLTSAMHMSWVRHISGRLKSDFQYGIGVVYNTFPLPHKTEAELAKQLMPLAQSVLDARAKHAGSSLADLYDPDLMPGDLLKAHRALDKAVDKLYRSAAFASDRERAEFLLGEYEKMVAPLMARRQGRSRRS